VLAKMWLCDGLDAVFFVFVMDAVSLDPVDGMWVLNC
jgi:hypothetical protein